MKVITISREFGSGGRELGKRLSDLLGYDYYDREIICALAKNAREHEDYLEHGFGQNTWKSVPLTFRRSFGVNAASYAASAKELVEQKQILEHIARMGDNCIIVGRNADVLLADYHPFNIFVCAEMEAKIQRCAERAEKDESLSRRELEHRIRNIDKSRIRTREMLTDSKWGQRDSYHLTVNTTDWKIRDLAPVIAEYVSSYFSYRKESTRSVK
jgi:cytidylate kinase